MILALKTDSMIAEITLIDESGKVISQDIWEAGRSLAKDLLAHIEALIATHSSWNDCRGVIVFQGPGSFTSLRIGITTANTIVYAQDIPIVGEHDPTNWIADGVARLERGENDRMVLPHYGADPHITAPKK